MALGWNPRLPVSGPMGDRFGGSGLVLCLRREARRKRWIRPGWRTHGPPQSKISVGHNHPTATIVAQNAVIWTALLRNLFSILRVFAPPCETYPPPPCDGEGAAATPKLRPFLVPVRVCLRLFVLFVVSPSRADSLDSRHSREMRSLRRGARRERCRNDRETTLRNRSEPSSHGLDGTNGPVNLV